MPESQDSRSGEQPRMVRRAESAAEPPTCKIRPQTKLGAGRHRPAEPHRRALRLAYVDDEESAHQTLHQMLALEVPEWTVESHPHALLGLRAICRQPPHLVLMDIRMPDLSGTDCAARLKAHFPHLPVVMWTARAEPDRLVRSLLAGADGYLVKGTAPGEVVRTLRAVLEGRTGYGPEARAVAADCFCRLLRALRREPVLSGREEQVLVGLLQGHSSKEIAFDLDLSADTVRVHLHRLLRKLGRQNRRDLLHWLLESP